MKRSLLWIAAILFASLPLTAQGPSVGEGQLSGLQNGTQSAARKFVFNFNGPLPVLEPGRSGCPVSMRAQQRTGFTGLTRAGDGNAAVQGQRIHLDVDRGLNALTAIQITVRGTTARPRVYAAQSAGQSRRETQDGTSDAVKSFTLTADGGSANGVAISSDILLRGFTSVQSVSLDSVSYADGSVWTPVAGKACSVAPDPLMLVSSR